MFSKSALNTVKDVIKLCNTEHLTSNTLDFIYKIDNLPICFV